MNFFHGERVFFFLSQKFQTRPYESETAIANRRCPFLHLCCPHHRQKWRSLLVARNLLSKLLNCPILFSLFIPWNFSVSWSWSDESSKSESLTFPEVKEQKLKHLWKSKPGYKIEFFFYPSCSINFLEMSLWLISSCVECDVNLFCMCYFADSNFWEELVVGLTQWKWKYLQMPWLRMIVMK